MCCDCFVSDKLIAVKVIVAEAHDPGIHSVLPVQKYHCILQFDALIKQCDIQSAFFCLYTFYNGWQLKMISGKDQPVTFQKRDPYHRFKRLRCFVKEQCFKPLAREPP